MYHRRWLILDGHAKAVCKYKDLEWQIRSDTQAISAYHALYALTIAWFWYARPVYHCVLAIPDKDRSLCHVITHCCSQYFLFHKEVPVLAAMSTQYTYWHMSLSPLLPVPGGHLLCADPWRDCLFWRRQHLHLHQWVSFRIVLYV